MMMQLVMISPTKTESCCEISKRYALSTWSTTITSDAMMVSCTMIRMFVGIWREAR